MKSKKFLQLLSLFIIISTFPLWASGETIITERSSLYQPRGFKDIDFVVEFGPLGLTLEELGENIDRCLLYSDVAGLVKVALELGIQEKRSGRRSVYITSTRLLKTAEHIAKTLPDKKGLDLIQTAYKNNRASFYNPEKASRLQKYIENFDKQKKNYNSTIIIVNNSLESSVLFYIDDIFRGEVQAGKQIVVTNIKPGKIKLEGTNAEDLKWGPRKTFVGKDQILHWKLY
ncbi:MAG: hypothetical protein ACLFQV_00195 [Vulcanimicrobiota bacterium]